MKKNEVIVAVASFLVLFLMLTIVKNTYLNSIENNNSNKEFKKIMMITDIGGINDNSFNESAWRGLQEASINFGNIQVGYIESIQEADYIQNIEIAIEQGNDLIISVGFALGDATLEMAKAYPEQQFAIIDVDFGEDTPKNLSCITFDEEQSGELVGMVAGLTTTTNKIAAIGGFKENPAVFKFIEGYKIGAKKVNKDIEIIEQYANSFTDASKGYAIASQMVSDDVDIIFTVSGGVNIGAIEKAKEVGIFTIGVDSDMNHIAPKTVLTSALKKVDKATFELAKDISQNIYKSTKLHFDKETGGVGYATTGDLIPQQVIEFMEQDKNNE